MCVVAEVTVVLDLGVVAVLSTNDSGATSAAESHWDEVVVELHSFLLLQEGHVVE